MKSYILLSLIVVFAFINTAISDNNTVIATVIGPDGSERKISVTEEIIEKTEFESGQPEDPEALKKYDYIKRYDESHDSGFDKKSIIKYAAFAGLIYHLWYYKLETITALMGAISHFFAGTNFSAAQRAQMHILARAVAYGGGLLALYGLMGLFDDNSDYDAALAIKRIISQAKISKKEGAAS